MTIQGIDTDETTEVTICGGGLAGLTLALQIQQQRPKIEVVVLERTMRPLPDACHKVGESTVELGSQYLERLGLVELLQSDHLEKFGLRFFPGGGARRLDERTEYGPSQAPVVRSYQLDRGRLENALRSRAEGLGIRLIEGVVVQDIALGSLGSRHAVTYTDGVVARRMMTRWVVDAMGRNPLLKKHLGLQASHEHIGHACWFRLEGRIDITALVPKTSVAWHEMDTAADRWRSTNHLMGVGYWVWIIPLAGGRTSVGLVVSGDHYSFESVRTYDLAMAFLKQNEPQFWRVLDGREVLDFRATKRYSHGVDRSFSADRWAIVGEAGAFVDPLYSPGTDSIALANSFAAHLVVLDARGESLETPVSAMNQRYQALTLGMVDVFRGTAPIYGHARAMGMKLYWDNFAYWSFPCQYYLQGIYRLDETEHTPFAKIGRRFVELSRRVQSLLRVWAALDAKPARSGFIGMPAYPSVLVDTHLDLQGSWTIDETHSKMRKRLEQAEMIVDEFVIRLVLELGPDLASVLLDRTGLWARTTNVAPSRIAAEHLRGLKRRHALSPIVRDVERHFGVVVKHPNWDQAVTLLSTLSPQKRMTSDF